MKKSALVLVLVLLASSAFAANQPVFKSWNKDGQFNIDASIGWAWGFTGSLALEFIITEFKIGPIPFDFGIAARGAVEVYQSWYYYGGTDVYWGAGPMATLHMGFGVIPIEFFISAGLAFYGWVWSGGLPYGYSAFNIGFGSVEGFIWHFSPNVGLLIEGGYMGGAAVWGAGVEIKF